MKINDGKGIFDKYGMLGEISMKMEALADARGVLRCGLIWDINGMIKALKDGLAKEDAANEEKVEALKKHIENLSADLDKTEGGANSV